MQSRFGRILLTFMLLVAGCTYKEIPLPVPVVVDCTGSTFALHVSSVDSTSNCLLIDGGFTIEATGGASPYVFSLNGGSFQAYAIFSNLGPGHYSVVGRDANQCEKVITVEIFAKGSDLDATFVASGDSECLTDNGSITITPLGSKRPFTFQFGSSPEGADSTFTNLKHGFYTIIVRDDEDCIKTLNVEVPRLDTQTSFDADIEAILTTNCAISGCHNGDNGASRNWNILANVQANAQNIKTRTGNRTMPLNSTMSQDDIDKIACWVDDGAKDN